MPKQGRPLTVRELARELDLPISVRWLNEEAKAGRIPSLDIGGRRLFSLEAVALTLLARAAADNANTSGRTTSEDRSAEPVK